MCHLVQARVHLVALHAVVAELVRLLLTLNVLMHLPLHVLHDGLSLAYIARTRNITALVYGVVGEHLVVGFSLQLLSLRAHLLALGDHAEAL